MRAFAKAPVVDSSSHRPPRHRFSLPGLNRPLIAAMALLGGLLLGACGGGKDDSSANVRVLNATHDYGSIDFYISDTKEASAVAEGAVSSYAALDEGTYTFKIKASGSSTTAASTSVAVAKETGYTIVAYNDGTAAKATSFTDNKSAPTSGTAAFRVFNGATASGNVDIYVTEPDLDLSSASTTLSSAGTSSYVEITKGTYRIRVTGAGDKSDLRLDVPSVALSNQQIVTFALTGTPGGVLVNGLLVNQGGTATLYKNNNVRLRLASAVTANGTVTASANSGTFNTTLQAPAVGSYVTTASSLTSLAVTVNGTTLDTSALAALKAGSDATLLVYDNASAPQVKLLVEDNAPASSSSNARLRIVNAVNGLNSTVALSADYVSVADNVAFGAASTPADIAAGSSIRLEATSPVRTTPLYTATDVSLAGQRVYTLFLMGDVSAPVPLLKRDR